MSRCRYCRGQGLVFIRYQASEGYDVAACECSKGHWWRAKWQLRAWAAKQDPPPVQIGRLEEFFTPTELAVLRTVEEDVPIKIEVAT